MKLDKATLNTWVTLGSNPRSISPYAITLTIRLARSWSDAIRIRDPGFELRWDSCIYFIKNSSEAVGKRLNFDII